MRIKTSELKDLALDWAVAKCEGGTIRTEHGVFLNQGDGYDYYTPSTDWAQGGPIIERERVSLFEDVNDWSAKASIDHPLWDKRWAGPTPLIAALRCYVASKLGDEVEIPKELLT
jgi:hypothetical protein